MSGRGMARGGYRGDGRDTYDPQELIDNIKKEKGDNDIAYEQDTAVGLRTISHTLVEVSQAERDVLVSKKGKKSTFELSHTLTIQHSKVGLLDKVVNEALIWAQSRFRGAEAFPVSVLLAEELELSDLISICAIKRGGGSYGRVETAIRMMIAASGELRGSDTYEPDVNAPALEVSNLVPDVLAQTNSEKVQYMAALGTAYLIMAIAKPFVSRVTSNVTTMCKNLVDDLGFEKADMTHTDFGTFFNKYMRKVDLRKIGKHISDRKYTGSQWLTSYAARHGAGTSAYVCIATAMRYYSDCPLWNLVDSDEKVHFAEGCSAIAEDPLLLFPIAGTPDLSLDKYRASSFPGLITISLNLLIGGGDPNWSRYQNSPYVPMIGGFSSNRIAAYAQIFGKRDDLNITDSEMVNQLGDLSTAFQDGEISHLEAFVQSGGKVKSGVQVA